MNRLSFTCCLAICCLLTWVPTLGQESTESPTLTPELSVFEGYLGVWEIDATWESGDKLWARNEYTSMMGGKFVQAKTFAKDNDGAVYHRYTTIYAWDAEAKQVIAHGYIHDGKTSRVPMDIVDRGGDSRALSSSWKPDPSASAEIQQSVWIESPDAYRWKVQSRPDANSPYSLLMDGTWKRVAPATDKPPSSGDKLGSR